MAKKLTKGPKKFFELLQAKRAGDILTGAAILAAVPNWTQVSFDTYKGKNKISPFLTELPGDKYRVIHDGTRLSESHFQDVFTQVKPRVVDPKEGDQLPGTKDVYVIDVCLGAGAVGQVWKAKGETARTLVAVKIMLPRADLLDPSMLENVAERFRREARNGLELSHDQVIRHIDIGEWEGIPFLVMPLADGSVGSELQGIRRFSEAKAGSIISACVDGLAYLHGENCIHRDVKPDNILRFGRHYVLGDLGIVKWSDLNPAFTGAATITRASIQLGSWYYMSPEQLASPHEAVFASDVYALGISWFEMLSGRPPDPIAVGAQKFPAPSSNGAVCRLITRMLSYLPADRPTAQQLRVALDDLGYGT